MKVTIIIWNIIMPLSYVVAIWIRGIFLLFTPDTYIGGIFCTILKPLWGFRFCLFPHMTCTYYFVMTTLYVFKLDDCRSFPLSISGIFCTILRYLWSFHFLFFPMNECIQYLVTNTLYAFKSYDCMSFPIIVLFLLLSPWELLLACVILSWP